MLYTSLGWLAEPFPDSLALAVPPVSLLEASGHSLAVRVRLPGCVPASAFPTLVLESAARQLRLASLEWTCPPQVKHPSRLSLALWLSCSRRKCSPRLCHTRCSLLTRCSFLTGFAQRLSAGVALFLLRHRQRGHIHTVLSHQQLRYHERSFRQFKPCGHTFSAQVWAISKRSCETCY